MFVVPCRCCFLRFVGNFERVLFMCVDVGEDPVLDGRRCFLPLLMRIRSRNIQMYSPVRAESTRNMKCNSEYLK